MTQQITEMTEMCLSCACIWERKLFSRTTHLARDILSSNSLRHSSHSCNSCSSNTASGEWIDASRWNCWWDEINRVNCFTLDAQDSSEWKSRWWRRRENIHESIAASWCQIHCASDASCRSFCSHSSVYMRGERKEKRRKKRMHTKLNSLIDKVWRVKRLRVNEWWQNEKYGRD